MRKLQAVPDRKLKSCCACTKLLLKFLSDRATARQSKKARAFLDLHGETSGKSTKGDVRSTSQQKQTISRQRKAECQSTSQQKQIISRLRKAKCKARAKSKGNPRQYIISQGKVEAKCEAQAQSMPPPHFPPHPK